MRVRGLVPAAVRDQDGRVESHQARHSFQELVLTFDLAVLRVLVAELLVVVSVALSLFLVHVVGDQVGALAVKVGQYQAAQHRELDPQGDDDGGDGERRLRVSRHYVFTLFAKFAKNLLIVQNVPNLYCK